MIKVLVFIKKLPGLSMNDFIRYYEDNHVPMVNSILPMYSGYVRNYCSDVLHQSHTSMDFDVVTELMFANEDDYLSWQNALSDPAVIARIRKDEAHFVDSAATVMWKVGICGTS